MSGRKRPRSPSSRAIIALDLDCFYASVAIRTRPHLKNKPVVVFQKHLCVTSNYVARSKAHGAIQKMTPVSKALKLCPDLICIDGSDLTPFRDANREFITAINSWLHQRAQYLSVKTATSPAVVPCQRVGFDEVFLDVTDLVNAQIYAGGAPFLFKGHLFGVIEDDETRRLLMVASQLAQELRSHVIDTTELTLCAGISVTKQLARLAVNMNKPNDQTIFLPDRSPEYIATLSPRSLNGFGYATLEKILQYATCNTDHKKVDTVGTVLELFGSGPQGLRTFVGIIGSEQKARELLDLCRGIDRTEVVDSKDAPKSFSVEDSCRGCTTMEEVGRRLNTQSSRLVLRIQKDYELYERRPKTLSVSYRFRSDGFFGTSRCVPMPQEVVSVCSSQQKKIPQKAISAIRKVALSVLDEHARVSEGKQFDLTLLALGARNFTNTLSTKPKELKNDISQFFSKVSGVVERNRNQHQTMKRSQQQTSGSLSCSADTPVGIAATPLNSSNSESKAKCPICHILLLGSNFRQNNHIDRCLRIASAKTEKSGQKKGRKVRQTRKLDSYFSKCG